MRDRLIELIRQGEDTTPCSRNPECDCKGKRCSECERESIADHLLANGVIVPPCKVGDTVYVITSDSPTGIEETKVSQIKVRIKENGKTSYRVSAPCIYDEWSDAHWTFCAFDFGKTVFLTRAEAERALRKEDEK